NVLTLPLNLPLVAALARTGTPTIAWTHDLFWTIDEFARHGHGTWPWTLFAAPLPGVHYVTVSETRRRELAGAPGLPPDDITVVPNGIDVLAFSQVGERVRELLRAVDALDAVPLVLVPQRVTLHKGMDVVLDCAAELVRRWPRLRVLVTGPLDPHS